MAPGAGSLQWLESLLREAKGGGSGGGNEEVVAAAVPLALTGLVLGGKCSNSSQCDVPHTTLIYMHTPLQ